MKLSAMHNHPDLSIKGFRLIEIANGKISWEFKADQAVIFEIKNKAYAEKVKIFAYVEGKEVSTLTADKGMVQTDTNDAEVEGHVVLIGRQRTKVETEHLQWLPRIRKIYSEDFVKITYGNGNVLDGKGFTANADMENIKILNPKAIIKDIEQLQNIK
jgi:LPS export ABC transporter protein LptC